MLIRVALTCIYPSTPASQVLGLQVCLPIPSLSWVFILFSYHLLHLYVCAHMCYSTYVDIREQLIGVSSVLPCKFQGSKLEIRLGGKRLYPLSHLAGSKSTFHNFLNSVPVFIQRYKLLLFCCHMRA